VSGLPLLAWEKERIVDILGAISAKDWSRFQALSDKPFINPSIMKEQFDASTDKVADNLHDWENGAKLEAKADRTRLIWICLPGKTPENPPIDLILHGSKTSMSIWVFYERYQP
jgi:hypothetical protein